MQRVTGVGQRGAPLNLLVVEAGRLTMCSSTSNVQERVGPDDALRLAAAGELPAWVGGRSNPTPGGSPLHAVVHPGRPVLGVAGAGVVAVRSPDGDGWVHLDADHLVVASLLDRVQLAEEVGAAASLDPRRLGAVLGDLERIASVRLEHVQPLDADLDDSSSSVVDVGRRPRVGRSVRRWTVGGVATMARAAKRLAGGRPSREPTVVLDVAEDGAADVEDDRPSSAEPDDRFRAVAVDERVPVFSFWATESGPHLGAAAVVAYARVHQGGALNETFDFRRAAPAEDVLREIADTEGPAVLLCSNYVWSLDANLHVAALATDANPDVVVFHGGPSTPRYEADCEQFLRGLAGRHVAVNGEGEISFAESLSALAADPSSCDIDRLEGVAGIRYIEPGSGRLVGDPERPRHSDLADFPSPLISGELDDVDIDLLRKVALPIETNRGCPYGCTFCDWGQATMSRIRKHPMDRVRAELRWLAEKGVELWIIADANFGMLPRDLEIVDEIVELRQQTGFPHWVALAPPKKAMRRFADVLDRLLGAGIAMKAALALQTRDKTTLEAIDRSNIGTDGYDDLKAEFRHRGLPLSCDLMVGLPGATVDSLERDLQWCIDQQIRAYLWPTFVLPNAPMNAPEYRERYRIRTSNGLIVETSTFSADQRERMDRLAYAYQVFECLGVLRHVLRFVQWDHGVPAMELCRRILDASAADPARFPLTNWLLNHLDVVLVEPVSWSALFDEVRTFLVEELGVADNTALQTVLDVNELLMPRPGRRFPVEIPVDHDYAAYWSDAQASLAAGAEQPRPPRRLLDYAASTVRILDDPDEICSQGLRRITEERVPAGFHEDFWVRVHWETLSVFTTYLPLSPGFVETAREQIGRAAPPETPGPDVAVELGAPPTRQRAGGRT